MTCHEGPLTLEQQRFVRVLLGRQLEAVIRHESHRIAPFGLEDLQAVTDSVILTGSRTARVTF